MIKNILTNFSARFVVALLNFCMVLLTTHFLGMDSRGEISTIMLSVGIIQLVSDLAGGPSLVYLIPRTSLTKLMFVGMIWSVGTSFITWYVLLLNHVFPVEYGFRICIIGILISFGSLMQNILLGQERVRAYNLLIILQGVVMFGIFTCSIFVFHFTKAHPYIIACYAGYSGTFLVGLYLVIRKHNTVHISDGRSMMYLLFRNGLFTQLASLGLMLVRVINFNLIEADLAKGMTNVGVFSTAFALGEAILLLSTSVSSITLSRVANNEDPDAERQTVLRLGKFSFVLTCLAVLFALLLPVKFYTTLFHDTTGTIKSIFATLCPGILFLSFSSVFSHYFSGSGKHYMNFLSSILCFGFVYFFAERMMLHYGMNGPGYTTSVSYFLLASFIVIAFLVTGRKKGEWKILLPSRADLSFVKNFMNKNSGL
ncbi:MAG TPA: hypothetical protein VL651_09005 [Bacteroidia bacterium]|jgi:O-antigen/teichoic acid export membrane protein|nr:hypothetical protein [Bacteroidia bacterium]